MPLTDFCKAPVITISPDQKVLDAVNLMMNKNIGCVVVIEQERPIGILTDRDLVVRVMAQRKDVANMLVREAMTPNPIVAPEAIGIWELIQAIKKHGVRRFPIVAGDGKLVGIITLDDLIELIGEELSSLSRGIAAELSYPLPARAR
jgi:CBS domain-containing protein